MLDALIRKVSKNIGINVCISGIPFRLSRCGGGRKGGSERLSYGYASKADTANPVLHTYIFILYTSIRIEIFRSAFCQSNFPDIG